MRLVCRRFGYADAGSISVRLLMRKLVWRCPLLDDAGSVAASVCCLVMLEAVLQVLLQSWLAVSSSSCVIS